MVMNGHEECENSHVFAVGELWNAYLLHPAKRPPCANDQLYADEYPPTPTKRSPDETQCKY